MYYLGVDLGGTNIAAGIVSVYGKLLYKKVIKTEAGKGFLHVVNNICDCVLDLLSENKIHINNVAPIGIGSPGIISAGREEVIFANNIDMVNSPMAEEIYKRINKKVILSNDANCAALGEALAGAAEGYKNVVLVTLGTGVGGGVIIDGKLFEGGSRAGAELGHISLSVDGEKCTCGRSGCWEAYASITALIKQTRKAIEKNPDSIMNELSDGGINITGRTAFDALRKGDKVARDVFENFIKYIAEGLIDITNIFRPEIILIGGGISKEGDFLLDPIRDYVKKYSYGSLYVGVPRIEKARLGNDAGIIGASMLSKILTL